MRALLAIATLIATNLACSPASALPEDLTGEEEVLPGSDFDSTPRDLANTGVGIAPWIEHVSGPAVLKIRNGTSEDILCEVYESDYCPALDKAVDALQPLAPGDTWSLSVDCVLADFACLPGDADDRTQPLRTWSWFVEPLSDD